MEKRRVLFPERNIFSDDKLSCGQVCYPSQGMWARQRIVVGEIDANFFMSSFSLFSPCLLNRKGVD